MGRPVFFTQTRVGRDNKAFLIIKFRTMRANSSGNNSDLQRLTKLGAFLRKYSIDEFPQLLNILKGDMSFIGPRPLLEDYLPFFTKREIIRHNVRPGMSGLAQVSGRSNVTWDNQFEMDAVYVERISFLLDLKILFKTIPKVMGSIDMMVTGRIDLDKFDVHRRKQIVSGKIPANDLNENYSKKYSL